MTAKVFIDGEAGTTGLQIAQRLSGRRDIELLHLSDTERKDPARRAAMLNAADVSILCLPDDAAREAVALIDNPNARVIDASTAHRTAPGWTYGFPEYDAVQPELIAASKRVTNPGCYACGAVSMLHPLVKRGLVPSTHPVTINAISGYSGGGKKLIAGFEQPGPDAADGDFYLYALGLEHKHTPEIEKHGSLARPPIFVPSVGRFAQGMIVSLPIALWSLPGNPTAHDLHSALSEHYAGQDGPKGVYVAPLTGTDRVAENEKPPGGVARPVVDPESLNGTDRLEIHVFANEAREQALIVAVLDNLGKGAAGQAVQNLELMLGLQQTAVPVAVGVYA